jgi:quercetin dioxygenase-like cupin family protein
MPVIEHATLPSEPFRGGATYQIVVGDDSGSTPIRLGIQTSPPGYRTAVHSHPYLETITVLEGEGEAWIEDGDGIVRIGPGMTLVLPANVRHWFQATGNRPLVILGVHASPHRIVEVHEA